MEILKVETSGKRYNYQAERIKQPLVKRGFDLLLASLGLILSAPLWVVIAVAIKLEDGGPIFFRQKRWGRYGSPIEVLKFRTMVPRAGNAQAKENDHRITSVGKALRSMGLDELPQLICIWRGDMSFVGPRALAITEIVKDEQGREIKYQQIPGFWERLSVRPGLTSLSTVYRRKDIHPRKKFFYDLVYLRKQSFWLDLKLILMSLRISILGRWESREEKI
jgi:lipopolysaccharide/colanic/teichoic acid biosynthesis glycosyltransferase